MAAALPPWAAGDHVRATAPADSLARPPSLLESAPPLTDAAALAPAAASGPAEGTEEHPSPRAASMDMVWEEDETEPLLP